MENFEAAASPWRYFSESESSSEPCGTRVRKKNCRHLLELMNPIMLARVRQIEVGYQE